MRLRKLGRVIITALVFCGTAAPVLCLSPQPRTAILGSQYRHQLSFSWQAKVFVAPVRFRLYRIDSSGSVLMVEKQAESPGLKDFHYVDRDNPGCGGTRFLLVEVTGNGSERTLGVIDCLYLSPLEGSNTGVVTTVSLPATLPPSQWEIFFEGEAFGLPTGSTSNMPSSGPPAPPPRTRVFEI